jgi:hypothetical protein
MTALRGSRLALRSREGKGVEACCSSQVHIWVAGFAGLRRDTRSSRAIACRTSAALASRAVRAAVTRRLEQLALEEAAL